MMHIQEITHKHIWENFLKDYSGFFPFFQTWQWGDVQKKLGFPVQRLGLFENEKLLGVVQVVEIKAKRGYYLHVRQGPVIDFSNDLYRDRFIKEIIAFGKRKHVDFIRMSPLVPKEIRLNVSSLAINAPIHNMDAQICWVLDITSPEQMLLAGMRKSHRYLIKKAQTLPIKIIQTCQIQYIEKFIPLYKKLAQKKHFVAHSGIEEELSIFSKDNQSELFLAEYEGKIICGALIDFVGTMAIYRHSASDENYRNIPAMYLLQWEVIKEAKKRGKKIYNFWGIAPNEQKNHPWFGLTLFKTGFGGEKKEFMHAKDIILSPKYLKTYAVDYLTKVRKGY